MIYNVTTILYRQAHTIRQYSIDLELYDIYCFSYFLLLNEIMKMLESSTTRFA
jgi:hypothetical protein